jgi:hypothetical protein
MYNINRGYKNMGRSMVTKEEVEAAFLRLSSLRIARIGNASQGLFLQPVDLGSKIHLSTLVYKGDNYIPPSVREASHFHLETPYSQIHAWLNVDEELFEISLHHIGNFSNIGIDELQEITSEFEDAAYKWREIFEEKDRQDLVHIPIQSK